MVNKPERLRGVLSDIIHTPGLVPVVILILFTAMFAHWLPNENSCYPASFKVNISPEGAMPPVRVDADAKRLETTLHFNKSRAEFTNGTGSLTFSIEIVRADVGTQDAVVQLEGPGYSPASWTWVKDDGRRFDSHVSALVQGGGEAHLSLQVVYGTQRASESPDDILFVDTFDIACTTWALFAQLRSE